MGSARGRASRRPARSRAAPDLAGAATSSRLPASVALLAATAVWGSTFVVTKDNLVSFPAASLLTWRFGLAAAVLLAVSGRRTRDLTRGERRRGTLLGVFLAAGFLLQTWGLEQTLASVSAFLVGLSIVLTPLAAAVVFGERIGRRGWAAVATGAVGLAVLSGGVTAGSTLGAALTLGGALGITGHITGLSQWATPRNALGLTAWSVTVAAVVCAVAATTSPGLSTPPDRTAWLAVGYLAVVATCLGFAVQAWAQSSLTATRAAVIMTLEPVFAALLAAAAGERGLTPVAWSGGVMVVVAMLLAELGPRRCCDAMAPRVECC